MKKNKDLIIITIGLCFAVLSIFLNNYSYFSVIILICVITIWLSVLSEYITGGKNEK